MTKSRDTADILEDVKVDGNVTAVGQETLKDNTGIHNTGVGYRAMFNSSLSGSFNVALGNYNLYANTSGASNTALGYQSLFSNTTASYNTAVGYQALYDNTTGTGNVAVGTALANNTTANDNTAVGNGALDANTTGASNVALGRLSLSSNTTASGNVAIGDNALRAYQTGGDNVVIGRNAGYTLNGNGNCTFLGRGAGFDTTGGNNTFVGYSSGSGVTSGTKNTIVGLYNGNQGGLDIRTSSNNIVLSDGDGNPRVYVNSSGDTMLGTSSSSASSGEGVKFRIGSNAKTISTTSNRSTSSDEGITMWSTGANTWRFYVGWGGKINATSNTIQAISDQRFKENIRDLDDGLSKVMELRPRKFDWKEGKGADIKDDRGFIAQEFEEVFPDLVGVWKDEPPEGEEPYKAVSQDLIPTLVKALQELSAKNDALEARITTLEG